MSKLRVESFTISIDGFGAGIDQSVDDPLGKGAEDLHSWFLPTDTFQKMHGDGRGSHGVDNDIASRGFEGIGAWIMGRNMFGPIRGSWGESDWNGWWGKNPPYHCPVFVMTHHARPPLEMEGQTTFYFVNDPLDIVLSKAFEAADGKDVRLGGGVSTIKQFLRSGLIDQLSIAISPVILGSGEHLFSGIDLNELGYTVREFTPTEKAVHLTFAK